MLQFYEPQQDRGTPPQISSEAVCLTIDGIKVSVPAGTSVMRAAFEAGVKVPKLSIR
jgi:formate dehydrogenase major subunit